MTNPRAAVRALVWVGIATAVVLVALWLRGCWGYSLWELAGVPLTAPVTGSAATVQIIRDTIIREVPRPMVVVRYLPARVKVIAQPPGVPPVQWIDSSNSDTAASRDTLTARPFTATADTIVGRDTVSLAFDFPPPRLSLVMRPGPDSIRTVYQTQTISITQPQPWYLDVAKIAGSFLIGYGLRAATEN